MTVPSGRGRHSPAASTLPAGSTASSSSTSTPNRSSPSSHRAGEPSSLHLKFMHEAAPSGWGVDTPPGSGKAGGKPQPQRLQDPVQSLRDRKAQAQTRAQPPARTSTPAASSTTTSSSTTSSPVLSEAGVRSVTEAVIERAGAAHDMRLHAKCEAELNHLGTRLKRPLDLRVVEQLTDRVIDTQTQAGTLNLGILTRTLVHVLDGPDIGEPALRTVFTRLLERGRERLPGDVFMSSLMGLLDGLGGTALPPPLRRVLLEVLVERLGCGARPDQDLANTCVAALCTPLLGPSGPGEVAARAVRAGGAGSVAARSSLLQALSDTIAAQHVAGHRGAVYLALVREAAPFAPEMAVAVGREFHFRAMLEDGGGEVEVEAWFAGLADWAMTLDATLAYQLLNGASEGLWNDTDFTPALLCAALAGLLSAAAPGHEWLLNRALGGLLGDAVHKRRLQAGHVTAILDQLEPLPLQQVGDVRASATLGLLCSAIAQSSWPEGLTEALVDGLLERAKAWPAARVVEGGRLLGECLSELDRDAPLFTDVLSKMAQLRPLDRAARLLGGFAAGLALDPQDTPALAAFGRALVLKEVAGTARSWILAASVGTGLQAGAPLEQGPGSWKATLHDLARSPADGKGKVSVYSPLAAGLDLLDDPVEAAHTSGLRPDDQLAVLEFTWSELCVPRAESLHRQVSYLRLADFAGDDLALSDMLLTLFQHGGSVAAGKSFLMARDILVRAIARHPSAPTRAGGDSKASEAAGLDTRGTLINQLEALYRYYLTASVAPSYGLAADARVVATRLAWLESVHTGGGARISDGERAMLQDLRKDYAHLLVGEETQAGSSASTVTGPPPAR